MLVKKKVLRIKKEEARESCRKLHHDNFHSVHSLLIIVREIKSRKMRWTGHVAHTGNEKCVQNYDLYASGKENT
jgi:hypothetical protein